VKVLIVKTSALGDIIQAIPVLHLLKEHYPYVVIDWIVEKKWQGVLGRLESLNKIILFDRNNLTKSIRHIREDAYDYVFDLQGNAKSGLITLVARSKRKIGLHQSQVREWPNLLATTDQIKIDNSKPMTDQLLQIVSIFFNIPIPSTPQKVIFSITKEEEEFIEELIEKGQGRPMVMICPCSRWENKRLSRTAWTILIKKISEKFDPYFFFVFGNEQEREEVELLHKYFPEDSAVIGAMSIPVWQNVMTKMGGVISVDSSALHLAGLAGVATFSIFGPTQAQFFQPIGDNHSSFQGACPYGEKFVKQCRLLRTCKTGRCIKAVTADELFDRLAKWLSAVHNSFDCIKI